MHKLEATHRERPVGAILLEPTGSAGSQIPAAFKRDSKSEADTSY